jgi:hypothetical protein
MDEFDPTADGFDPPVAEEDDGTSSFDDILV